jgi:hypothetical protein
MLNWIEASLRDAVLALAQNGETELAASLRRLLEEPEVRGLQLYRSPEVEALGDAVLDCETLDDLYGLFGRICSAFSVAHCTILRIRERTVTAYGTKMLTTYPDAWLTEYIARRYFGVDPVIARALEGPGVFFWDEVGRDDPITAHFLRSAAEHGIGPSGITFVTETVHGDAIAVSLAVPLSPTSFRRVFMQKRADFDAFAALLVDVFSDITCEERPQSVVLTDDQLKVLKALASGRSREEIETFPCTYGSFATLEKSILRTLNARTLVQAVAISVGYRLLETLPCFEEDIYPAGRRSTAA